MRTVHNEKELKEAIKDKEASIRVVGPYAEELAKKIRTRKKVSKTAKIGGALAIAGGVLAAPFTGGMSLVGTGMGVAAFAANAGAISTTALLALIGIGAGTFLIKYGIDNMMDFTITNDNSKTGHTEIVFTHKK